MKKILFSAFALFSCLSMSAENSLQVVPFKAAPGTDVYASIVMNNETPVCWMQFDLYTPDGIRVYTNKSGNLISSSFAVDNEDGRITYYDEDEEDDVTAFGGLGGTMGVNFVTVDGKEAFRFGGVGNTPIYGNSGKVFKIRIKVADTVAPGVYPIVMKNIKLQNNDATGPTNLEFVSYVVVGEPTNESVALETTIPSFVNAALANETAIKTLDLTDVTASYGDFTYVAGRNVVAPSTSVAANVKFDAPLAGTYGSFCAPVDVNVDCYTFTSCDGTTAVFTPATTAPAGTPVLINKAVKTAAQAATLQSVQGIQISSGYYVAADGSGMHSVNTLANIPALRGAWDFAAASSNLRIAIETPTGLQVIGTADEVFGNTYDLQGRQVQEAHNGVFVVNGKKQFVK